jgi:hypothetical protein
MFPGGLRADGLPAALSDPRRLAAVRATGLLDTEPEQPFDDLADLASTITGCERAFITLVDEDRSLPGSGPPPVTGHEPILLARILAPGATVRSSACGHRLRDRPSRAVTDGRTIAAVMWTVLMSSDHSRPRWLMVFVRCNAAEMSGAIDDRTG